MKVVLLAAGRSVRMQPIPDKNFLRFLGKPLVIHQLEALAKSGFREILLMGGAHNLSGLRRLLREHPVAAKITVHEQKDLNLGMAGALLSAASWIKSDPFLVVSGNDVVDATAYELLKKHIEANEGLLVAQKVKSYFPGGYLKLNASGIVTKIVEKPRPGREPSKLVNIVVHYHPQSKSLLNALKRTNGTHDDHYERALQVLFDEKIVYRTVPYTGFWQPVKYPWHVLDLMEWFVERCVMRDQGSVEIAKSAKIYGKVYLENGVRVFDHAVIQGPAYIGKNTLIATNALVRQSHIGANCVIGFGSEIARSFLSDHVWTHANYIGDSVIGKDVSFGAGSVTGNFRLDEKNIMVSVKGATIDSGRNKFGIVTGNHIRVGINTSFMPGVRIGSNSFVGAGIVVAKDVPDGKFVKGEWKLKMSENRERIKPR